MFEKTYELPLSRDYVAHWGVPEAVRELLQNALDSDSPMEYSWASHPTNGIALTIRSRNARLEPKTLLLGLTSKAEAKDKIGSFGEGYKIALLVLTREQRSVTVYNAGVIWTPSFKHSKQFDFEVLSITETKHPEGRGQGLSFVISGLTPDERQRIIDSTMQMQESVGEVIETSKGQILRGQPGRLYVNGLFVCETEFKFGYNMKPEFLKLERDRQTVSSFDLAWITKQMWFETGANEEVAVLMATEAPDLQYANYNTPEVVKEACYQHFKKEFPGHVVAATQTELKDMIERGMTKTVFLGGGAYSETVRASRAYKDTYKPIAVQTPEQHLRAWFSTHRGNTRSSAIVDFKKLLSISKAWRAA